MLKSLKAAALVVAAASALFLTSCLNVVQSVSLNSDGKFDFSYQFTMNKMMLAMMNDNGDPEAAIDGMVASLQQESGKENLTVEKVSDEQNAGFIMKTVIDQKNCEESEKALLPVSKKKNVYINLIGVSEMDESQKVDPASEESQAGLAMLDDAFWTVRVGKNILSSCSKAVLADAKGKGKEITVKDEGDFWSVDVLFADLIIKGNNYTQIVFTK